MMPPKWGDNAFKQCRVAPGVSCVFTKANRKSFWPTRVLLILDCFQILTILIGRRRVCAVLLLSRDTLSPARGTFSTCVVPSGERRWSHPRTAPSPALVGCLPESLP